MPLLVSASESGSSWRALAVPLLCCLLFSHSEGGELSGLLVIFSPLELLQGEGQPGTLYQFAGLSASVQSLFFQAHSKIIAVQVVSTNFSLLFQACFQKSGASVVAIRKYIIHKYPSLELERRGYLLKQALKRELERGIIRQVRAALWSSAGGGITQIHKSFLNSVSRSVGWSCSPSWRLINLCLHFVRHWQNFSIVLSIGYFARLSFVQFMTVSWCCVIYCCSSVCLKAESGSVTSAEACFL